MVRLLTILITLSFFLNNIVIGCPTYTGLSEYYKNSTSINSVEQEVPLLSDLIDQE